MTANVFCEENPGVNEAEAKRFQRRSCYFNENSICLDIQNKEWIFSPKSNVYDNLGSMSPTNKLFPDDRHTINLNFATRSIRSAEETKSWRISVKRLDASQRIKHETVPVILGVHTRHTENVGHVILDSYFSAFAASNNWFDGKVNMILNDDRISIFDASIGISVFNQIKTLKETLSEEHDHDYDYICYQHISVTNIC